ncbi:cell division protein ZapA [Odoribacter sp. OttesenSCG-928-J03]|nr:cell division protein ZapA [Odoribacter sp. OttesenSCG-928-J03]MDL2330708.1 cell division protein ZapA [Odoribacter sp. OttesenSCG-928-A06]
MSEKDKVSINIRIADRMWPIVAQNQEEEEIFRAASKRINDMISMFQERYPKIEDPVDFLYLTTFQHVVTLIKTERRNDAEPILNEIEKINIKIDQATQE